MNYLIDPTVIKYIYRLDSYEEADKYYQNYRLQLSLLLESYLRGYLQVQGVEASVVDSFLEASARVLFNPSGTNDGQDLQNILQLYPEVEECMNYNRLTSRFKLMTEQLDQKIYEKAKTLPQEEKDRLNQYISKQEEFMTEVMVGEGLNYLEEQLKGEVAIDEEFLEGLIESLDIVDTEKSMSSSAVVADSILAADVNSLVDKARREDDLQGSQADKLVERLDAEGGGISADNDALRLTKQVGTDRTGDRSQLNSLHSGDASMINQEQEQEQKGERSRNMNGHSTTRQGQKGSDLVSDTVSDENSINIEEEDYKVDPVIIYPELN